MKTLADSKTRKAPAVKGLAFAIATTTAIASGYAQAAPTGGNVVAGDGSITQSGNNTRIDQNTQRLSLDWDTFNVGADERVQFVQPNSNATALNRILDNNGSRILGQIDANGHVILMNPNGIFFGQNATVNVGGLIASGLNINSSDFMNGDFAFREIEGSAGTVINRGIINAATGGNVALLGKSVENHGMISANLGHVALASGSEAVVTFDEQGLIGVRIDKETLATEVGVRNSGTVKAEGGKILLNASVSADLFSAAVNHGAMSGTTSAVVHDDGSFTLGAGSTVVNTGTLDVSTGDSAVNAAGYAVVAGETVDHRGTIRANASGSNRAGQVYLEANDTVQLGAYSTIEANNADSVSGKISIDSAHITALAGAKVATAGDTLFSGDLLVQAPQIDTHNLYVQAIGDVLQTAAITATGNLHIKVQSGADVSFTNSENDFNTLSFESGYTSGSTIVDKNSIKLGNLDIIDSVLTIEALGDDGSISQLASAYTLVEHSALTLKASTIDLGTEDSRTDVYYGMIDIEFSDSINTNNSISLDSTEFANSGRIVASYDGMQALELRGEQSLNLNAKVGVADSAEYGYGLTLHEMSGKSARLEGIFETTQTGPITLSDSLTWNSYRAFLDNPQNDIATLAGTGAIAFGALTYVDKNSVTIGNLDTVHENSVTISTVGSAGKIVQAPNVVFNADFIELDSSNIELGANGTSEVNAGYVFDIDFGRQLNINGPYSVGSYAPTFRINGDSGSNRLMFGRYASTNSFAADDLLANIYFDLGAGNDTATFDSEFLIGNDQYWGSNGLHMGSGNDFVFFNRSDVHVPVTLGSGRDLILIRGADTHHDLTDYDSAEDRLYHFN